MRTRSTELYVANPFRPGTGLREQRLNEVNRKLDVKVAAPEEYRDKETNLLMDNPCDIRIRSTIKKESSIVTHADGTQSVVWSNAVDEQGKIIETTFLSPPCYVDASTRYRLQHHPSGNLDVPWLNNWVNGTYAVNPELSKRIEAWITIEEIRKYVDELSTKRYLALKAETERLLPHPDYDERLKLLRKFATSTKILKHTDRVEEDIPKEFLSDLTGNLMTLPVKLGSGKIIDFHELFTSDEAALSAAAFENIMKGYRAYCKEDLSNLQNDCEHNILQLDAFTEETLNAEEKNRIIEEARDRFKDGYKKRFQFIEKDGVRSMPLEEYAQHFNITELVNILPKFRRYYDSGIARDGGELTRCKRRVENAKLELVTNLVKLKRIMKENRNTDDQELVDTKIRRMTESIAYLEAKMKAADTTNDQEELSAQKRELISENERAIEQLIADEEKKPIEEDDDVNDDAQDSISVNYTAEEKRIARISRKIELLEDNIKDIDERIRHEVKKILDLKPKIKAFIEKTTFEWWVKNVFISEAPEHIDPFTKEPVTSIEVQQDLLVRLDEWLDPLKEQIRIVEKHVESYASSMELMFKGSYAEILRPHMETDTAPHKDKCYLLTPSYIPGTRELEIATHPILLDGIYVIDYGRLKNYWGSKGVFGWMISFVYEMSWHGYNPFTGQKCQSIVYMHPLKQETDQYMKTVWCAKLFKPKTVEQKVLLLKEDENNKECALRITSKQ